VEARLNFKILFSFNDYFSSPTVKVGIDDCVYYNSVVLDTVEFDCDLAAGSHVLFIEHYGKLMSWTTAEQDHHVFIKKILFDNVDLDQLNYCPLTHRGKFYPYYESSYVESCKEQNVVLPEFISPNHYLGHNGIWRLDFNSPELLWIIKEQNPSGINLEDTIFSTSSQTLNEIKNFFDL
jgi:hypothetical protein